MRFLHIADLHLGKQMNDVSLLPDQEYILDQVVSIAEREQVNGVLIVASNNKQRYSFNDDHTLIRANQGHSIAVDVELKECPPPAILYHGTGEKYVTSILKSGLIPKSRLYVHLSKDIDTALNVGSRHGKPVVFKVDTQRMSSDGIPFFLSVNGVWLTKHVPVEYLAIIS